MNKFSLNILVLLCVAMFWGCQTDNTNIGNNGEGMSSLTISIPNTRTALGDKVDGIYPVSWSESDCIVANGVKSSEAAIDSTNPSNAIFDFGTDLSYPIKVTYPYTSATTANAPKVVFPTEQQYTEGTFATESAPMCGYAENPKEKVAMAHLAGVLRFSIKGAVEGTTLQKVIITSTDGAKLSGEFAVDCTSATITATDNSTNTITYLLPENFTLSPNTESVFYITIPAGNTGACKIEFIESAEHKMVYTWSSKNIKAGIVREFKTITYNRGVAGALEGFNAYEDNFDIFYPTVYGYVKDTNGNPISGVAVSDGFSVVATDTNGYYSLDVSTDTWYIFISLPSEYEVPINEYGQPCFYQKYPSNSPQYDFVLTPLAGGKEEKFALVTLGDPQVSKDTTLQRFLGEAVPGIKTHIQNELKDIPCYGITLGDIISNGSSTNSGVYRNAMRDGFAKSSIGFPVFQVMGNHDNTYFNSSLPIYADERNSTFELKAQREHEDIFGPVNYSFNRGDVHIIGMRDIIYTTNISPGNYKSGFLDSQWEWLQQDLALVPKEKMVVICVHIPLNTANHDHISEALSLLNTYKEAHIMSGHTHIVHTIDHKALNTGYDRVYEHNIGAVCGCWWSSNICSDGSPNGFGVFISERNTFTDWYYSGYHEGMNSRAHQMRLYRGNAVTGGAAEGTDKNGTKGYYAFGFGDDYLLANVYNSDGNWVIKVYEDGVYTGNMVRMNNINRPKISAMAGDGTFAAPRTPLTETSADMYFTGLRLGIQGSSEDSTGNGSSCHHMYKYKLKNKNAQIKVEAIDTFGNKYTETKITEGTDYSLTQKK